MNIFQTETGIYIYYLHDYIPKGFIKQEHSAEGKEISEKILDYKAKKEPAFTDFTKEFMQAIAEISKKTKSSKIGLVAVPSSDPKKKSTVISSIELIEAWNNNGIAKEEYDFDKKIINHGDLITRTKKIRAAHLCKNESDRPTYEEQTASLSVNCSEAKLSKLWTTFIILDDIATCGTSMKTCTDLLLQHGAVEKYI